MDDEQTTEQGTEKGQAATAEQEPQGDATDELAAWKGHARKHEDRAKALASEVTDLKKQIETLTAQAGRVADLEQGMTAAEKRAQRAEIAAEVASATGVRLRYLTGETREEMEKAAEEYIADARALSRVGIVPSQGTGESAPRVSSYSTGAERARAQLAKTKKEQA